MQYPDVSKSGASHPATSAHLTRMAREWGYRGEILFSADGGGRAPLLEGMLQSAILPSGLRICTSDVVALQDSSRAANLAQSLTIVFVLGGDGADHALETSHPVRVLPGQAVMIAAADETRLFGTYRLGEHSRCVAIQACPSELLDHELAERVDRLLTTTRFAALQVTARVTSMAHDLFQSHHTKVARRLLSESCALELLCLAIEAPDSPGTVLKPSVKPLDVSRMMRVHDKLIEELDQNHRLSDLAREVGVSVSVLKEKFPAVVGQSVFAFLRDRRLERARHGLASEGWSVSQAAYYVGYRHPANFSTAFRRKFGMSPNEITRH